MSTALLDAEAPRDPFRSAIELPPDHAERATAADEVHARPPLSLTAPARATYLAVTIDAADRDRELAHVAALCADFGVAPPKSDGNHFKAVLGNLLLKWERHTEFSAYTFVLAGLSSAPFSEPPTRLLPAGWLVGLPGRTVAAVHAKLVPGPSDDPPTQLLSDAFGDREVIGARVGDGAGAAFTDLRIQADGHVRIVLQDRGLTPRQSGRMLQRLFEIEAYRVMALLGLPLARQLARRIATIERSLDALAASIADESGRDEALLAELTQLSAEVERLRNGSAMRLAASRAYHDLVSTRIGELREGWLPGFQTLGEFMTRRLNPAMATCTSTSRRMHDLSERVAHASGLLSTRVEVVRERQNQALLASMDRRARLQLRLQHTVEWLSVAAVTYYAAGLLSYLTKALEKAGVPVHGELVVGGAIPVVAGLVAIALYRTRRKGEAPQRRRD